MQVGVAFPPERRRVSRQLLTDMNVTQLQVLVNDLHTLIEGDYLLHTSSHLFVFFRWIEYLSAMLDLEGRGAQERGGGDLWIYSTRLEI